MQNSNRKVSVYPGVHFNATRNRWTVRIRRPGKRSWSKSYPATGAGELRAALEFRTKMNEIADTPRRQNNESR
jgi:hypothetical protein